MKPQRIYIAGPMTGLPDLNFPAFHAEAARLRAQGHTVINPAEINPDTSMSWQQCMRTDIAQLVTCDAVQLLPGWERSKGATLEHHIAERLDLVVYAPQPVRPINCGTGHCSCIECIFEPLGATEWAIYNPEDDLK